MKDNWKTYKIKDVVEVVMGQSPPSITYNDKKNGLPFYQGVVDFGRRFVNERIYCTEPKKIIDENFVLLSVRAPVGKVNLTKRKCAIGRGNAGLRMKNGEKLFLFYLLKYYEDNFHSNSEGTVFSSINKSTIENLEIEIPPVSEQKAIAAVLSSLDDKIDLLHRQNKTLEALAETLFRQWFIEPFDPAQGGKAQDDWEEVSLFDAIELVGGGTPKTSISDYWNGNINWLSGGDIAASHKGIIVHTEKTITEKGLENSSTKLLPEFSTVISARGTVGKYCILSKPMAFSQSNYGIKPKFSDCYFFTYLLIAHSVEELKSAAYGSVFDTITTNTFKEHMLSLPKPEVIKDFENEVKPLFKKILNNQLQIRTLEKLRDTLLPKLMSGEVQVKMSEPQMGADELIAQM